jgi:hypothetical protein
MMCPCKDCEMRRPGCHGSCDLYKTWRAPLDAMGADKDRARIIDAAVQDGRLRRYTTRKRKRD